MNLAGKAGYPCTAHDSAWQSSLTAAIPQRGITGYKSVGNFLLGGNKRDMQSAVMPQPVSVGVEADWYAFQAYRLAVLFIRLRHQS